MLTCYSPVRRFTRSPKGTFSLDLHVLGTPPAFVLSQDQTLQFELLSTASLLFGQISVEPVRILLKGTRWTAMHPISLSKSDRQIGDPGIVVDLNSFVKRRRYSPKLGSALRLIEEEYTSGNTPAPQFFKGSAEFSVSPRSVRRAAFVTAARSTPGVIIQRPAPPSVRHRECLHRPPPPPPPPQDILCYAFDEPNRTDGGSESCFSRRRCAA